MPPARAIPQSSPVSPPGASNRVALIITECVGAVLGADLPARVVRLALQTASVASVPERGPALFDFVSNSLSNALLNFTDADTADSIICDLRRSLGSALEAAPLLLAPIDQDIGPPSSPVSECGFPWADEAPTRPAFAVYDEELSNTLTPPPERHAWVLFLSNEAEFVETLGSELDPVATVLQVTSIEALKDALAFCPTPAPIVVIRAVESGSQAKKIGRLLPPQGRIVLWGSRELVDSCYAHAGISHERLMPCAAEAKSADLSMLIRAMLHLRS